MAHFWPVLLVLIIALNSNSAEPPKVRSLAKGGFSGIQEATELVITNATQWSEVWKKHSARQTPAKPAPEIDFERENVLLVTLGQKSTGGYAIQIAGLRQTDGRTEVTVQIREPKPGGIRLQALTSPFHIVAVPKVNGPVKFIQVPAAAPKR